MVLLLEEAWLNSERPDVGSTHATETFWNPEIPAEEGQRLLAVAKCFRTPTDVDRIVFGLSEVITVVSLCGGFNTVGSQQLQDRFKIQTLTYVDADPDLQRLVMTRDPEVNIFSDLTTYRDKLRNGTIQSHRLHNAPRPNAFSENSSV